MRTIPDYQDVIPDVVFERRLPTEPWIDVQIRLGRYMRAGVGVVSIADELRQQLHVFDESGPHVFPLNSAKSTGRSV
jgi:hypothetical protein